MLTESFHHRLSEGETGDMLEFEHTRAALKNRLKLAPELGRNPYMFGLIGSTDAHTGLSAVEEESFFGKTSGMEPNAARASRPFMEQDDRIVMEWEIGAAGHAAVWATENARAAIFDAMERREACATTASRMIVRFFGGWSFQAADAQSRLPAEVGSTRGVPMGGDLARVPAGADGKLPAVGSTVDAAAASWTDTIGDPQLITVWRDPDFDPDRPAFYYARALEIPTPRWPAYDAKFYGLTLAPEAPLSHQERAYTSPIWYTP